MKSIVFLGCTLFIISACFQVDEPEIPNEEELITTLHITLTPQNGGDTKELLFQDLDGDGGNAPLFQTDTLEQHTLYIAQIELFNEQFTPPLNITDEVEEEGVDHQFFYEDSGSNLLWQYDDQDAEGNPIGLHFLLETQNTGNSVFTVILRHEPNKYGANVAQGDITNAGGETDIQVNFDLYVE